MVVGGALRRPPCSVVKAAAIFPCSEQYAAWQVREKQALDVLPQRVNTMAAAAEGGSSLSGGSGRGSNAPKRLTRHRRLFGAAYS
jgi:hypothetical protein